jgi:hypothetical protein
VAERHALGKGTKMADQLWQYREFPGPTGEQDAVVFLNAAPGRVPAIHGSVVSRLAPARVSPLG